METVEMSVDLSEVDPAELYREEQARSIRRYWEFQHPQKAWKNKLLRDALMESGVDKRDIRGMSYLPIQDCVRDNHYATDVIIFDEDSFTILSLNFDGDIVDDLGKISTHSLEAILHPNLLNKMPYVRVSFEGEGILLHALLRGYLGTFSKWTLDERREDYSEIWPYKAGIAGTQDGGFYLACYAREGERLSWFTLPVKKEDKEKLEWELKRTVV